jgi:hypothetical protein
MKRIGLWAIGLGALVSAGPLAVDKAYGGGREGICTLATLNGQYLFNGTGTLFPPAFGLTSGTAIGTSAGFHIFNGDGTGMDFVTFTLNGVNLNVPSPVTTTYTLNQDCTGTYSVPSAGLHFDIFVAVDGSALTTIDTDPGAGALFWGPQPRVGLSGGAE